MTRPYGAKLISSSLLLTLSIASVGATGAMNVKSGLSICIEAGVVMAVASVGPPIVSAFVQMHGRCRATVAAMSLCCVTSVWCELHAWTDSQATLSGAETVALSSRDGAQGDLDQARRRLQSITEPLSETQASLMVSAADHDVKNAEEAAASARRDATDRGVRCEQRTSCLKTIQAVKAAKDVLDRLRERLGLAQEKARLLAQVGEAKPLAAQAVRETAAIPGLVAGFAGWSKASVVKFDHVTFTLLMVMLNMTFSLLGGRAFKGVGDALAARRGMEWDRDDSEAEVVVEARAVRPPTDAELIRLAQTYNLRELESQFRGVSGCSKSALARRLQGLRALT